MDRESLVARVGELIAHPPAVVLVDGAAGLGKSWLAARVLAGSTAGVRALVECLGLPDEPKVLLREVVRALVEAGCDPAAGRAVITAAEQADVSAYRTCAALRELLAGAGSALLVVDDLRLADRWSRGVLRCCATRLPPGVAMVLTSAPWPGPRVELAPLRVAEVAALVDAPEPWVAEVHRLTGGIPLLVNEVLDRITPADGEPGAALVRAGLPRRVLELVADRLNPVPAVVQSPRCCAGRSTRRSRRGCAGWTRPGRRRRWCGRWTPGCSRCARTARSSSGRRCGRSRWPRPCRWRGGGRPIRRSCGRWTARPCRS
ncbi:hypothetical protein N8J89_25530 [Crossiella sp. CA-258035]|uniref:hypothetical protein n=1 Tax=Crossiella sp. CA-258035 TaxID=2981138 RepID=UPI0024BC6130|nr:hypothetical protein [Crossiella sp. CA-258035]WHT16489.1 hypothetical protein N8J89_25530 [Crossiella sp. CA-258035]